MMRDAPASGRARRNAWWPFTATEFELALAVLGLAVTGLSLLGVRGEVVAASALVSAAWAYLAALLVRARETGASFEFIEDGGVRGRGYVEPVRRARASLLLQHVDDDAPSEELRAMYRECLARGVALRRLVFLRRESRPESLSWIAEFGEHPNLEHRIVLPEQADMMRLSFVVVDEREVVISIPGISPLDSAPYSSTVVLRHVVRVREPSVAAAFVRIHEHIWQAAKPVDDVAVFSIGSRRG